MLGFLCMKDAPHRVQMGWGAGSIWGRVQTGLLYPNQQCPQRQSNLYNNNCTCAVSVRVQSLNGVSVRSPKSKHVVQMGWGVGSKWGFYIIITVHVM